MLFRSAVGSLTNETDITILRSGVKVNCEGSRAFVFGSYQGGTRITLTDVDLAADMATESRVCAKAKEEDVHISGGKCHVNFGSGVIDRFVI